MGAQDREVSLVESEPESSVSPILEHAAENGESLHTDTTETAEMAGVSAIMN